MMPRWLHRLLGRPGIQHHTVPLSEYEREEQRVLDDYHRRAEAAIEDFADRLRDQARAALDPDSLPDVNLAWDRADEIAVERDYDTYRYDLRLPGERVL